MELRAGGDVDAATFPHIAILSEDYIIGNDSTVHIQSAVALQLDSRTATVRNIFGNLRIAFYGSFTVYSDTTAPACIVVTNLATVHYEVLRI